MHYRNLEQPFARGAIWCWRFAFFGFCLAAVGLFASRRGLEPAAVAAVLCSALFFAFMALPLGAAAIGRVWSKGCRGTIYIVPGLLLASSLLSFPVYLAAQNIKEPFSTDFSTDAGFPPAFSLSRAAMAARRFQVPSPVAQNIGELQRKSDPAIHTLRIDLEGSGAFAMVLNAAASGGWQIIESHAPGGRMGYGHIDAIARSPVFHFENDISIRLVPLGDETLVDMRVSSRLGSLDIGQNAKLIGDFLRTLQSGTDKPD